MTKAEPPLSSERKRGSGVRIAYELLRDEILSLSLAPGAPLDEAQLAERFGMSRTPIREALVRLAAEGLVDMPPNRSTAVSNIDFLNMGAYFDALTLMHRMTARLAAEQHRPQDLRLLRARQAEFNAAAEARDGLGMIATNAELHLAIAQAGRNPYFTAFFQRLLDEGRRLLRLYYLSYEDELPQQLVDEHDDLLSAIAARDVEAADRLGRAHGEQVAAQIQVLFSRSSKMEFPL